MYRDAPSTCTVCGQVKTERELLFMPDGSGMWCLQCSVNADVDAQRHRSKGALGSLGRKLAGLFQTRSHALASQTEISSLAHSRPGSVIRIVGVVTHANELVRADVTHRPCVGFTMSVVRRVPNLPRNGSHDEVLVRRGAIGDFSVHDPSGTALVRATGCTLLLANDTYIVSGVLEDLGTPLTPNPYLRTSAWDTSFHYREGRLDVGSPVAVLGVLSAGAAPNELVLSGTADQPLIVATDPHWLY